MKRVHFFKQFCIGVLLFSCATTNDRLLKDYDAYLETGNYESAYKIVVGDDFYKEERSKLLKLLEIATIHHKLGNYYQSLKFFDEGKELSDRLFTVSLSKKAETLVGNDALDNYYGELYERSEIRLFIALNHLLLYTKAFYEEYESEKDGIKIQIPSKKLNDSEKRFHLTAARSAILEWDSLLESYRASSGGESVYKDDLMAKLLGHIIHAEMGTSSEKRIAKDLLQKSKDVLFKNFNSYPTYNKKADKFRRDFKDLYKFEISKVKEEYIEQTDYQKGLIKYIDDQLDVLKKSGTNNNLNVIIQNGSIAKKRRKIFSYPIPLAAYSILSGQMGTLFAAHLLNTSPDAAPSITFELPEILPVPTEDDLTLKIVSLDKKTEIEHKLALVNPLSDMAVESIERETSKLYVKTGARLAMKHAAAIAAAYTAYKAQTSAGTGEYIAQMTAAISYSIAAKGIAASEKADIRCWRSLPHDIRIGSLSLKKGEYSVSLNRKMRGETQEKLLGTLFVDDIKKTHLLVASFP